MTGILFDDVAVLASQADASPLFASMAEWRICTGTSFTFLSEAWRRFPHQRFLLLTDGDGQLPAIIPPADHRRTAAIVIPQGRSDRIQPLCDRLIVLDDLRHLAAVMAMLVPRNRVA